MYNVKKTGKNGVEVYRKKEKTRQKKLNLLFVTSHQCIITNITKEDNKMKTQSVLICGLATTVVVGALGVVALVKAPTFENFSQAKASTGSVTLNTKEKLQAVTFSELDLGAGSKDKQFQISLGNDKYINGALIFSDCGNQFVGDDLSDSFGLDVSKLSRDDNAFNFNFLFSFEKNVTVAEIHFTVVDTTGAGTRYANRLRYSSGIESDSSEFYTTLRNNLSKITSNNDSFFNGEFAAHENTLSSTKTYDSLYREKGSYNNNTIIDLNFNSRDYVPRGDIVTIQITSISFTYECK